MELRPHQERAIGDVRDAFRRVRRVLLVAPTGFGKCLGKGTPVLRFDGTIVPVEDVRAGDVLMGPDSRPRRVLSLAHGASPLYRITPHKGDAWVCNDAHILTLVHTVTGEVLDVGLQDYLASSKTFRHVHKQFAPPEGIDFQAASPLPIDPYFLGVWFGDGTKALAGVQVSKPDPEIAQLMRDVADEYGLRVRVDGPQRGAACPTFCLSAGRSRSNALLTKMRAVVGDASRIPHEYLTASRADRAAFLAGILDTDGHMFRGCFEIVQRRKTYAESVAFLARSLGLRAVMRKRVVNGADYWRVSICGDTDRLPLRIVRKKAPARRQKKVATRTGFRVDPIGHGEYFGFELDGDGRFLLGDFTVTHNTAVSAQLIAWAVAKHRRVLFLVHRREIVLDTHQRLPGAGLVMAGERVTDSAVQVASIQTVVAREQHPPADLVVWDEAHHCDAETYRAVAAQYPKAWHLGLTATPQRADGAGLRDAFDEIVVGATVAELVDGGYLAPVDLVHPPKRLAGIAANAVEAWVAHAAARPTVAFHGTVAESRAFVEDLAARGIEARHIDGGTRTRERDDALRLFAAGRVQVLSNAFVLTEGWDCARAKVCLLARGCGSDATFLQMVGRVRRVERPGERALIIDLAGAVHEHGHPDEPREYTLDGIRRPRSDRPWITQCQACGCVVEGAKRGVRCPMCGAAWPAPKPVRVQRAALGASVIVPRAVKDARLKELLTTAEQRGYRVGWVGVRFKEEFGHWPAGIPSAFGQRRAS